MPSSDFGSSHFAFVQAEVVRDLVPHRLLHQLLELRGGASHTFVRTLVDRNFVREQAYFDPFAFASVRDPRFGNAAMNLLRGPGVANWDFGLFRKFSLSERFKLEFRTEAFNFSNTPHFNNPGTNVSAFNPEIADPLRRFGGFTEITGTSGIGRDGVDERQFRFGLRVNF